jgi:hypothetical protein
LYILYLNSPLIFKLLIKLNYIIFNNYFTLFSFYLNFSLPLKDFLRALAKAKAPYLALAKSLKQKFRTCSALALAKAKARLESVHILYGLTLTASNLGAAP